MKTMSIVLLAVAMLFAFTACNNNGSVNEKNAPLAAWEDASTIASQRGKVTGTTDNDVTITAIAAATDGTQTPWGGYQADVTMENSISWSVESTITLPTKPTNGTSVSVWTDSDTSKQDQIRTDANIAAVYNGTTWEWQYYDETGVDAAGTWEDCVGDDVPASGDKVTIEYKNGAFALYVNDSPVATYNSDAGIDNRTLEWVGVFAKNIAAEDSVTFTKPVVTYIADAE